MGVACRCTPATAARVSSPPASAPCAKAAATRDAEHAVSTASEGPEGNGQAAAKAFVHRLQPLTATP